MFGNLEM